MGEGKAGTACPVCSHGAVFVREGVVSHGSAWNYCRCGNPDCGHWFVDPMPVCREEEAGRLNNQSFYDRKIFDLFDGEYPHRGLNEAFNRVYEMERLAGGAGRLADVGCGTAKVLLAAKILGWDVLGIDASREIALQVERRFGVPVLPGTFENVRLEDDCYDVLRFAHVLEHLPDVHEPLRKSGRALKRGGLLVVEAPYAENLLNLARNILYRARGLNRLSMELMPPVHLHSFSRNSLHLLLKAHGFNPVKTLVTGHGDRTYADVRVLKNVSLKRRVEFALTRIGNGCGFGSIMVCYARKL